MLITKGLFLFCASFLLWSCSRPQHHVTELSPTDLQCKAWRPCSCTTCFLYLCTSPPDGPAPFPSRSSQIWCPLAPIGLSDTLHDKGQGRRSEKIRALNAIKKDKFILTLKKRSCRLLLGVQRWESLDSLCLWSSWPWIIHDGHWLLFLYHYLNAVGLDYWSFRCSVA